MTSIITNSSKAVSQLSANTATPLTSKLPELTPGAICLLQDWKAQRLSSMHGPRCSALWDGINCWLSTSIGHSITKSCPKIMKGNVTRHCLLNATWYWNESENYTACFKPQEMRTQTWPMVEIIRYTLFIGSISSFLFLSTALFLFYHFKSIRCDRITIHIHFMLALLIKSSVMILISDPTSFSHNYSYRDVGWICKLVIIVQMYSFLASVNWMLIQGHFLNSKLSTDIFQRKHKLKFYYCFGWGIPCLFVLVWYTVMETYHGVSCWRNYSKSAFVWIIAAPMFSALLVGALCLTSWFSSMIDLMKKMTMEHFRNYGLLVDLMCILILKVNLAFFINIVRVLLTKGKNGRSASETEQFRFELSSLEPNAVYCMRGLGVIFSCLVYFRRASKATAFLFPLLGINNLIFFFNPGREWQVYYMMTNAVLQPLQGVLVPVLYCFICRDVHECIRREYKKFTAKRGVGSSARLNSRPGRLYCSYRGSRPEAQTDTEKYCTCDFSHNTIDI